MGARTNHFKQRLAIGEIQQGLFCGLTDPIAAEISSSSGVDWLLVDLEHGRHDLTSVLGFLQASEAHRAEIVVRPPVGDAHITKQLLDLGVQSLLVPMVESAAQAEEAVAAMRYPPAGRRGVGVSLARASLWNRREGYVLDADQQMCCVVQIESPAGVDAIEEIAAVDGVDALFVGPSDLGAAMGFLHDPTNDLVADTVTECVERIVATGTPAGVFAAAGETRQRAIERGATLLGVGSDVGALALATAQIAQR